jgi:uncharacterized membrane protein
VWLASALWFPVVLANLVAIALGITLPFVDDRLGDQPSLPITLSTVEETFGALAAGMITFTGIVFSARPGRGAARDLLVFTSPSP